MPTKLILIGGGGHCHACIDVIETTQAFDIVGIIDVEEKIGQTVLGYPIIGSDNDLPKLVVADTWFLITVGHIQSAKIRQKLFEQLQSLNANMATIISPHALVSRHSQVGTGTIIMHKATVSVGVSIGQNCIINTGADVEHDSTVGNHVHISTHVVINGNCNIGNGVFVGSNTTLFQGVTLADQITLSAGEVIRKSLLKSGIYMANKFFKQV
jgi:sugar O-acyltransferase (sialic acid O-acetyltransferase NeuD family)